MNNTHYQSNQFDQSELNKQKRLKLKQAIRDKVQHKQKNRERKNADEIRTKLKESIDLTELVSYKDIKLDYYYPD